MSHLLALLRDGEFLTRPRIRLWAAAFVVGFAAAILYMAATAHGLNDYKGRPLGTDFSDVYTAGLMADEGAAAAAYDPARHYAREQAVFGHATPFYGWHYPPFFLAIAAALSQLSYLPALILWQAATLALYLAAVSLLLPRPRDPLWLLLALAFPAVFVNLGHGQNGFLTTALFAGALGLLDRRPVIAGILFGLVAYKPQFGVIIPLVLAVSGRWRCFAAA
ncbi:MAG: DUF2029 domain-containing protein, partial [Alphaproteobacteria bacterium]|nr:DUF2029 domain-containing protein [Alphaproteobacteria bacterium]